MRTSTIVKLSGSSGATGVVGGIAALVRSRHPWMNARQVMTRLEQTSGSRCSAPIAWRDAMVNAHAAVGGLCVSIIYGPELVAFYNGDADSRAETYSISVSGGVGPYSIQWMTGESTTSITQRFHASDGSQPPRHIWVDVRDLATADPAIRNNKYVRVLNNMTTGGGGCEPVPPQITC